MAKVNTQSNTARGNPSPDISVIIPSARYDHLPPHLKEALDAQIYPPYEIIFIADKEKNGAAWARNQGISQAKGDLIAFLDDDCVPPPNWLQSYRDIYSKFKPDICGGTYQDTSSFYSGKRSRKKYPKLAIPDQEGWAGAGGNIVFTKSILEKCYREYGFYFNPAFRISQDWELLWRCRKLDVKTFYNPCRVKHNKHTTFAKYMKEQFKRGVAISMLHRLQKADPGGNTLHKSLLWENSSPLKKYSAIIVNKVIGPFDFRSFENFSDFSLFWLGEKVQSLGFIWGMLRKRKYPLEIK